MNIIDAIARLDRAGQEHSKATAKLREATCIVARKIAATLEAAGVEQDGDGGVMIPTFENRAYHFRGPRSTFGRGTGWSDAALFDEDPREDEAQNLAGEGASRDACLLFASHVSAGLLDHVAAWLEGRAEQDRASRLACLAFESRKSETPVRMR